MALEEHRASAPFACKMAAFKVGGDGKPVRARRGPATVIGDANRDVPLAGAAAGKARGVGP